MADKVMDTTVTLYSTMVMVALIMGAMVVVTGIEVMVSTTILP